MNRTSEPDESESKPAAEDRPTDKGRPPHAVIVQGTRGTRQTLSSIAAREGYRVSEAESVADARAAMASGGADVVLLNLTSADRVDLHALDDLGIAPGSPVVLIGTSVHANLAVEGLRRAVTDYLTEPVDRRRLRAVLADIAADVRRSAGEGARSTSGERARADRCDELIGTSKPMQSVYDMIGRVGPTSATVIVTGESGTGKELVARAIHARSRRRSGPFEAINCGAISPQLFESELFGHERGSFTGADRRHRGCVERANRGTLFLDEVAEMPVELQVKMLRILETGLFTRVGGETGIRMDARVIAATNRDITEAVADGSLREDLYYRLKIFQIYLPPLRDRLDDIEPLTTHFLERLSSKEAARKRFSDEACEVLRTYAWPGNVRELRNVVHSAWIMSHGDLIDASELPEEIRSKESAKEFNAAKVSVLVGLPLAEVERRLILATLDHHRGNKSKAAKVLGISLKTLYTRLHRYRGQ